MNLAYRIQSTFSFLEKEKKKKKRKKKKEEDKSKLLIKIFDVVIHITNNIFSFFFS